MKSKVCTKCNQEKQIVDFSLMASGKYGRRSQCKPCRNAEQIRLKEAREERDRKIAELEAASRQEEQLIKSGVALPRTFNHLFDGPWDGRIDQGYVRNDGNKHIKSRGFV